MMDLTGPLCWIASCFFFYTLHILEAVLELLRCALTVVKGFRKSSAQKPTPVTPTKNPDTSPAIPKREQKDEYGENHANATSEPGATTENEGGECKEASGVPTSSAQAEPTASQTPEKPTPVRAKSPPSNGAGPPPPPPRKAAQESANKVPKIRPLFWKKIPTPSTVWEELPTQVFLPVPIAAIIKDLFSTDPAKKRTVQKKTPKGNEAVKIVCDARAQNISIMMTRFKSVAGGIEGVCRSLLVDEDTPFVDVWTVSQIAPKGKEIQDIGDFDGCFDDLPRADKVLVAMAKVPRLREKALCRLVCLQWEATLDKVTAIFQDIARACDAVKRSERLKLVFRAILVVGNEVNRDTARGEAKGVSLESLGKLRDTKTVTAPTEHEVANMLDVVVLTVHAAQQPQGYDYASFLREDLEDLFKASQHFLDGSVTKLVEELRNGFESIESELSAMAGVKWAELEGLTVDDFASLKLEVGSVLPDEERRFAEHLFKFAKDMGPSRMELEARAAECEASLRLVGGWLGADGNYKGSTTQLLKFIEEFDTAYGQMSERLEWD